MDGFPYLHRLKHILLNNNKVWYGIPPFYIIVLYFHVNIFIKHLCLLWSWAKHRVGAYNSHTNNSYHTVSHEVYKILKFLSLQIALCPIIISSNSTHYITILKIAAVMVIPVNNYMEKWLSQVLWCPSAVLCSEKFTIICMLCAPA